MVACAAIGDSIAVGVGQARPECVTTARVGITSTSYINSLLPLAETNAQTTIISLGVNDDLSVDTIGNLRAVRRQVTSRTVYWLLPNLKEPVREAIQAVAAEHGDRLIDTRPYVGRDHLHPTGTGYQQLAAQWYGDGGAPATSYAYAAPAPVEVAEAEAPPRSRLSGQSSFHIDYPQIPPMRVSHGGERDYFFVVPHRLSSMATPRDRIRNLRETARLESRGGHQAYSRADMRLAEAIVRLPEPPRASGAARHGAAASGRSVVVPVSVRAFLPAPHGVAAAHPVPSSHAASPASHAAARPSCVAGGASCARSARG